MSKKLGEKIIFLTILLSIVLTVRCQNFMIPAAYPVESQPMYQKSPSYFRNDQNMMTDYNNGYNLNRVDDNQIIDEESSILSEEDFRKFVAEYLKKNDFIPNRDKKSKYKPLQESTNDNSDSASDSEPLMNHRRKNFFNQRPEDLAENIDNANKKQSCSKNMLIEPNKIIDSKSSVNNGAILLSIEMVTPSSVSSNINELQENCMSKCCNSDECDSALLSLDAGKVGYRCYLFKCSGRCLYVKHKDYVVIRIKSQDQIDTSSNLKNTRIKTGENPPGKTSCNSKYEFTCIKSGNCIAIYDVCDGIDHCDDKSDEFNCTTNEERKIYNDMYNVNTKKPVESNKKNEIENKKHNADIEDEIDKNEEENVNLDDDYEEFKLMKEQSSIIEHLKELEGELFKNDKSPSRKSKDQIVYETPKGYLDSFLKPNLVNKHKLSEELLAKKASTKKTITTITYSNKKSTEKSNFHDNHENTQNDIIKMTNGLIKKEDAIYFSNKDSANASSSNIAMAVIILVMGVAMVVSFFAYLFLSTKYVSKRISWLNKKQQQNKNVDVDGDYLINGMYL